MFGTKTLREFFMFMYVEVLSHASLQHKAVKDEGGQKGANCLPCLHITCKAMNPSNLSEVKTKLHHLLHKTCSNVIALTQH